jgi:hypothetical protein
MRKANKRILIVLLVAGLSISIVFSSCIALRSLAKVQVETIGIAHMRGHLLTAERESGVLATSMSMTHVYISESTLISSKRHEILTVERADSVSFHPLENSNVSIVLHFSKLISRTERVMTPYDTVEVRLDNLADTSIYVRWPYGTL